MRHRTSSMPKVATLLVALSAALAACAESSKGEPDNSIADYASGVDAFFSVETFALSNPTITITQPAKNATISCANPTEIQLFFTTANFTPGKIRCYLDGSFGGFATASPYKFTNVSKGVHTIGCILADDVGQEYTFPESRAAIPVKVACTCANDADCNDGNACSNETCVSGKCAYGPNASNPACCFSDWDCSVGWSCQNPNDAANAKCAQCTTNTDCDDTKLCTNDTCDKGTCVHTPIPECCEIVADPACNDGQACTTDGCDLSAGVPGTCTHTKQPGTCCTDSECASSDPCKVGQCVNLKCRYGLDNFKPDCCSSTSNPKCDDGNICTVDTCDKQQAGGQWTQCSHVLDQNKPGCCVSAADCEDSNCCTTDVCIANQCQNQTIAGCCAAAIDCDDNDVCTFDACKKDTGASCGACTHAATPECCTKLLDPDCNDNLYCTKDDCDTVAQKCTHTTTSASCCDLDSQCDDTNTCTLDLCVNHTCQHGADPAKPNCCVKNTDCSDLKYCTVDTCDTTTNTCTFVPSTDPNCCNSDPAECDDKDCTTIDTCTLAHQCAHKTNDAICTAAIDCDDGLDCTTDSCDGPAGCGTCSHVVDPASPCCTQDNAKIVCDDGEACTADSCTSQGVCKHDPVPNCCHDDTTALTECDDKNGCNTDYCLNNTCKHSTNKAGCCVKDTDCNDGIPCTTDTCGGIDPKTLMGTCTFTKVEPCDIKCNPNDANDIALKCDDGNPCTVEGCTGGVCTHAKLVKPNEGPCCIDKFDCDDGNACTADLCIYGFCHSFTDNPDGTKACCSPATQDSDCAYLNSECSKGVCELNAVNQKYECVTGEKDPCVVTLDYCQDFSAAATSLKGMGWNPTDVATNTAADHWSLDTTGGLGSDQYVTLTWAPTIINYNTCLQSPVFQAAGVKKITMQWDHEYIHNLSSTTLTILGTLDGYTPNWASATVVDVKTPTTNLGPETLDVTLPDSLSGSNGLRLAFCVSGDTTFNFTSFNVDNVCVVKGVPPTWSKCAGPQSVPLETTLKVPLKAKDADAQSILTFSLVNAPSWVSLSSAVHYWLDDSWNTVVTFAPTAKEDVGVHTVTVKVSDGHLYRMCTFKVTVTFEGDYLIWKPSEVPMAVADPMKASIQAQAGSPLAQIIEDLAMYPDLTKFKGVFVTLGVYPNKHVLQDSEVGSLKIYLSKLGKVYMEGGDTWYYDTPATTLHPFFKFQGVADQDPDGITGPLKGYNALGDPASLSATYQWAYDQSFDWNNFNDTIEAKAAIKRTKNVLNNEGVTSQFTVMVGHDDKASGYRTVASSVLFGGVVSDAQTPDQMMERIIYFLDHGFEDCKVNSDCNDGNACTDDICQAGECVNSNTCVCKASGPLACSDNLTNRTTNAPGSTNKVNSYSCPGINAIAFPNNEISWSFKSAQSKPVTVKIANVTEPTAYLIILKESAVGCDPLSCVSSSAVAGGTASVTFAAAANVTYYAVVDTTANGTSATFDISATCAEGEICNDGIDNNANGKIDCADLASCCGDPTCPEVCDDIDNDCNNQTDENCDGDGDLYCTSDMTVVGTPASCPKGGLDCNDNDTAVNPGAAEICSNNKDDNCNITQDEEGANGCVEYYADVDKDGYGTGTSKCLCAVSGVYTAVLAGDCDDGDDTVNPGKKEICANGKDDNCDGTQNDLNAEGCSAFYTDLDNDAWGVVPFKCQCVAEGAFSASKPGDCNDLDAAVNPDAPEMCNCKDDNCDGQIDEGCDDDLDFYCDIQLVYVDTASCSTCPLGPGDTDDLDPKINPGGKEICDGKDNDSDGLTDEECDDDGDKYCDSTIITVGKPAVCPNGGGDCHDGNALINPGMTETCDTAYDDNCNGTANDVDAINCVAWYFDGDGDKYGTKSFKCYCDPVGNYSTNAYGDCNDADPLINPGVVEKCDGVDNDCDGVTDNGCDEDLDGYCDATKTIVGNAAVCPNGGGDCDDLDPDVNPSKPEICGNGKDDNCSGTQNDEGGLGCTSFYSDLDQDNYGSSISKCLCTGQGSFSTGVTGDCNDNDAKINPIAQEICNDIDDNCDGVTDESCDKDGDGYCDANITTVGKPAACLNGGGDCNDNDPNAYPGATAEICDGADNNCNGVVDENCDKDQDGYCDATNTVIGVPAACPKGGGDCNDLNSAVFPGAPEICGNSIDDNCNGSQNDNGALGCTTYYFDADKDLYGNAVSKCLCATENDFTATMTGDCEDGNKDINPGVNEICNNGIDDNCDGTENLVDATGCSKLYWDEDDDNYGLSLNECLCFADGNYRAAQPGDCNDQKKSINPGATEVCDGEDNDCDAKVDEGCDDDADKFCDASMTVVGFPQVCILGGGDCKDADAAINPSAAEKCDDIDNNCDGNTDESCDKDGDGYCDANLTTVGTPAACAQGGNDCNDNDNLINPGAIEVCGNVVDENCTGSFNDVGAQGCKDYYVDADADTYGASNKPKKCICVGEGDYLALTGGDCNDANETVNPGASELCDGVDNDCDGAIDEGCDDDNDGYCDANMVTIGKPVVCPNGGNDCADSDKLINPGATEICGNAIDENCDGSLSTIGATGCTPYYWDADSDGFGVNVSQCLCGPTGNFKATQAGDCDDTDKFVNPTAVEKCGTPADDNCDGDTNNENASGCVNHYADGDSDGYGTGVPKCFCSPTATYKTTSSSDCVDTDAAINPGAAEDCDSKDNNCNGQTDEQCDGDGDKYCNAAKKVVGSPSVCPNGGGDCNDTLGTVNPGAAEKCDNADNNCNGMTDDGCDDDKDGYCDATLVTIGLPPICPAGGNDCDDTNSQVRPGKTEICDDFDNNCNGQTDEQCDKDGDTYCDVLKAVVGKPAACSNGGGDCDDTKNTINPGAPELCDGIDNNCAGGIDETCKDDDKDGYCTGASPVSAGCPKGGGDCDDSNALVNPGVTENCATGADDNCNGQTNEVGAANCIPFYKDVDGDNFGIGTAQCQCYQDATFKALAGGDCNDANAKVNPNATEVCDNVDNDCKNGIDDGCDTDNDDYCNEAMQLVGAVGTCSKGGGDCNDADATVNPGKSEICDNKDNNCNGLIDEDCDADGDGYCTNAMTCSGVVAICPAGCADCDDTNSKVNGAMKENCTTPYDDNCNGSTNELNADGCTTFYEDKDGDGWGTVNSKCLCSADVANKYTATKSGDCDDNDPVIFSGAANETCDGKDNNCNGSVDEGCDKDADGYCDSALNVVTNAACPKQAAGGKGTDCNDLDKMVNPGATENCDDVDNNCNGVTDDQCDKDGDKYCDKAKVTIGMPKICINGGGDCDDGGSGGTPAAINPGASETCNGKDDNCNSLTDEENPGACAASPITGGYGKFYYDGDKDTYGIASFKCLCASTEPWTANNTTDCNDTCGSCYPGATEQCDNQDNNCNSQVDEGCDDDNDNYCDANMITVGNPATCTKGGGDCNDADASKFPGQLEICNNVDDNCNGTIDEGASDACIASAPPNALVGCVAGACAILKCAGGWTNPNGLYADGCECSAADAWEPNDTCGAASEPIGAVSDVGTEYDIIGRVADTTDEDWFKIYAKDLADSGYGACDHFNLHAEFTQNPGGIAFDIYRGDSCPTFAGNNANAAKTNSPTVGYTSYTKTSPSTPGYDWSKTTFKGSPDTANPGGWNQVCCGQTSFDWGTWLKSGNTGGWWSGYGECPCQTGNQWDQSNVSWNHGPSVSGYPGPYGSDFYATWNPNVGPNAAPAGPPGGSLIQPKGYYFTECRDDSSYFWIRVYKASGAPQCASYKLHLSNGITSSPNYGKNW